MEDEELTLRDFLDIAREYGVASLTSGRHSVVFQAGVIHADLAPPLSMPLPTSGPPKASGTRALFGPKGPPAFRKAEDS